MSNDLVESLSGGDIQPYDAGQPLAPMSHDSWANPGVDLLREDRQHAPPALTMFGAAMPAGTTEADVQRILDDIGTRFVQDMGALKYPANLIGFAAKFYRQQATAGPRQVRCNHNFELPTELKNDWLATEFCNRLENIEGTKRQKQQFLTNAITWLARLVKAMQQNVQSPDVGQVTAQGRATSSTPLADLTDAQYQQLVQHNETVKYHTLTALQAKYGEHEAGRVVATANNYLASLSRPEQLHFDQWTGSFPWVHAMNCASTIEFLYRQSIGAANLPTSGSALAAEIEQCHDAMRTNRKAWLSNDRLQSRYRELLRLRDGG